MAFYSACFLGGAAYVWTTRGRLPGPAISALEQAEGLRERGDIAGAVSKYRMLARIDRGNYAITTRIADLEKLAGNPNAEIEKYLKARELWPRSSAVQLSLGWAYFKNRRFDEAVGAFRRALELQPGNREALAGIGEYWLERDRYAEAAQAFGEGLRQHPQDAGLHNSLGITYALWGRRMEALEQFETAVRLHPSREYVANLERARLELHAAKP